ncbi:hypothetical protein GCM10012284_13680 [Mangrovihabitans endophyticus]|uniref:Uncharacterized protein n=1 Tax=Mangrovihabitans endophyticus TaxID=1751298 RepID=A0A8J3BXT2_9ACTN|nr:hypothetical protein GCM10012284_13680 [Mangrovihabitans endophyticus]
MRDEAHGIILSSLQRCRVVEKAHRRIRPFGGGEPGESALAGLACAIDEDNSGVGQCLADH